CVLGRVIGGWIDALGIVAGTVVRVGADGAFTRDVGVAAVRTQDGVGADVTARRAPRILVSGAVLTGQIVAGGAVRPDRPAVHRLAFVIPVASRCFGSGPRSAAVAVLLLVVVAGRCGAGGRRAFGAGVRTARQHQ